MRIAKWAIMTMGGIAMGATVFEAAFGDPIRWGVVFLGTSLAIASVFLAGRMQDIE